MGKRIVSTAPQSVAWFRKHGYVCETTEQTIRYPDKFRPGQMTVFKRDLFNAFDGIAVSPEGECVFFQATAESGNKSSHQKKIEESPATLPLLRAGNAIELHVWKNKAERGARRKWELARYRARLIRDDFANDEGRTVLALQRLQWEPCFAEDSAAQDCGRHISQTNSPACGIPHT